MPTIWKRMNKGLPEANVTQISCPPLSLPLFRTKIQDPQNHFIASGMKEISSSISTLSATIGSNFDFTKLLKSVVTLRNESKNYEYDDDKKDVFLPKVLAPFLLEFCIFCKRLFMGGVPFMINEMTIHVDRPS